MTTPGPSDPAPVFVYGTLMPGRLRWDLVKEHVTAAEPARVAGALYDTGRGYPAACFDDDGEVPGWVLTIEPSAHARLLALLDRVEGDEYRRVRVATVDGRSVEAYDWVGARDELVPLSAWEANREHER
jgi:gamma-glutamylcyclotransferase (GGCT)/AIG2-like uncharacterized protein YtfP